MNVNQIKLCDLLPRVFSGMERPSQTDGDTHIWLNHEVTFARGCRLCISAESGGGKSSLLSFIYGNRNDYLGRILFDDKDIRSFSINRWCRLRQRHLALLPQEMRLFPELTAMQNIGIKNSLTNHKTEAQILALLDELGIADKRDTPVAKLSIGQQQRVALVRTLCQPFDFIFLDEPVSHLDKANNMLVAAIVDREAAERGAGIISTSVGNRLLLPDASIISL